MNWSLLLTVGIGLTVAVLVGALIHRDASGRGVARPAIWSISVGLVSGAGIAVSVDSASAIHRTLHEAIHGRGQIIAVSPFEVLLTGLFVGIVVALAAASVYAFSTRSGRSLVGA